MSHQLAVGKFWIVWRPGHDPMPSRRHPSLESAVREANRLAMKEPPAPFYVLECVGMAQIPTLPAVTWFDAITTDPPAPSELLEVVT